MSKYAPHGRSSNQPRATSSTICQKCLGRGHFVYECKNTRPYVTRPSRTQQLENPKKFKPSVEVVEEFKKPIGTADKILEAKEKERSKEDKGKEKEAPRKKAKRSRSASASDSDSESSSSDSDSDSSTSDSDSDSSDESDGSRSREPVRKRQKRSRSGSEASRGRKSY